MPPTPLLKVRIVLRVPRARGFEVISQRGRGSHRFMQHADGRTTTVSGNEGDDMPRGLPKKVMHNTELTVEDFTT